ncbi:phosphate-starvation-inducible protein PsiF [Roseomonas sp. M0104]|uniref:Phosphate-starvation-inducible protein PsiF n=1 Tax=Teichococcus coralli TaxID=2545983 RepID=A0A845BCT1_9PROT|nr:PsiF family protein [Pseudoroseomonas coralli]MXP63122.1 phosphate-starvation-inducible protein PsiF [Pseudoroseomonas coralli]
MRIVLATLALAVMLTPLAASAQGSAPTPQQDRMKACNSGAGTQKLEGDARRKFMSDCLAGRVPATGPAQGGSPAQAAQRQRMTGCNATAAQRKLSGTARQDFMKSCLSGN